MEDLRFREEEELRQTARHVSHSVSRRLPCRHRAFGGLCLLLSGCWNPDICVRQAPGAQVYGSVTLTEDAELDLNVLRRFPFVSPFLCIQAFFFFLSAS